MSDTSHATLHPSGDARRRHDLSELATKKVFRRLSRSCS